MNSLPILYQRLFLSLLLFFNLLAHSAHATNQPNESRAALVIGNAAYNEIPLKNAGNDAEDMAAKLRELGFTVVYRKNLQQRQIGAALAEFRNAIQPGGTALFYYAGHGLQVRGENFLPTVDADIQGQDDVPNQSVNVNQVLAAMEESKSRVNLVFLDACRNNPYTRRFRSTAGGLAQVNAPSGTLIHFATRPGSVASDGDERNGLYTAALLKALDSPGLLVEQVLKQVTGSVKLASAGRQEPWMEGSLDGDFYFRQRINPALQVQALLQQSRAAFADKKPEEVVRLSRDILALEPKESAALANMAAAYLMQGKMERAGELIEHSLALNPEHGSSYNNRGVLREKTGERELALRDYQRGCQLASTQSCRNAQRLERLERRYQ